MDTNNRSDEPKRVLLAHEPDQVRFFLDALDGLEVVPALRLQEAERLIVENGISLFVVGIHFDDSRAMQLITSIRTDENHKDTPILVVRLSPSEHEEMLRMSLDTLVKLNIVSEYIEMDKLGKTQRNLLRKVVDKLLAQGSIKEAKT